MIDLFSVQAAVIISISSSIAWLLIWKSSATIVYINIVVVIICNRRGRSVVPIIALMILILILMLNVIAIELDKLLAGLRQPKPKHLVVKVHLHILMPLLEFSDRDFLTLVQVSCVGLPTAIVRLISVQILVVLCGATTGHAFHIEDGVRVDY